MLASFEGSSNIIREYVLEIGLIQVYQNYLVAIFDHGANVTIEQAYQIASISEIHFGDQRFGYISLRKHAYSIDPTIYIYLKELTNLKAFAIVSQKRIDMHNFKVEKMFYQKNMKFFIEFDNALSWVKQNLERESQRI